MTAMLQRICWNSIGWRGPTGERFGKEDSYVGKIGFGHEEWNFNTSDLIEGRVYGYSYYRPNENTAQSHGSHAIYFFGIQPNEGRKLVGFYKNARFLSERERDKLKRKFQTSELLEKRLDELLSLELPTMSTRKKAQGYLLDQYSLNIEVAPEDVHVVLPSVSLTRKHTSGKDPRFLSRYTKPVFLSNVPVVTREKQKTQHTRGSKGVGTEDDFLEDEYLRFTPAQRKVIRREHNQLSNRFRAWLRSMGATNVRGEKSKVDVICNFDGATYLFELKVCFQENSRHALREAIGQILEYRYYPGRPAVDHLCIVLDAEPSRDDREWFAALKTASTVIELYWLKGDSVFSAHVTSQSLAKNARSGTYGVSDLPMVDPVEPLSAAELGKALGNLSDETVRLSEQAGELFSIVRPQRERGREYPAFQSWPGIAGAPLTKILAILHTGGGTAAYGFFTSPNAELAGLTPIEVLIARVTRARTLESYTATLLAAPNNERLKAVLAAAADYAAVLAA